MKQLSSLIVCAFFYTICFAQERAQADVSITSVTLNTAANNGASIAKPLSGSLPVLKPGTAEQAKNAILEAGQNLKCSVKVHNENDDDAYPTTLVVVLPVEVSAINVPSNATIHKSSSASTFTGYITFDLGHMTVGQNITVEFTFTKSKYGNKVGAYAYSGTPDPNPTNNYKEASY